MKNWLLILGGMALLVINTPGISKGDTQESESGASFYIKGGEFIPRAKHLDLHFNAGADGIWTGEVGMNWKLHQTFELGIGVGYNQYQTPANLTARYRFDYMQNQLLVPFVAGGLDVYRVYKDKVFTPVTSKKLDRWQYGYHYAGGIQILLDRVDPSQSNAMYREWGVKRTYLNLEASKSIANSFGKKSFDYGGELYSFGLVFEY